MKKLIVLLLILACLFTLPACSDRPERVNTIEGNVNTYYEMSDGTWEAMKHTYKHRLELKGMAPNTTYFTTYVYLSNIDEITFERAWKAATFSSAYFDVEEAVLVETITE